MICTLCGGKGHAASFFLKDGTKQFCAFKIVRIKNGASAKSTDEVLLEDNVDGDAKDDFDFEAMTDALNALKQDIAYTKQIAKKTYKNTFRARSNNTPTASFTGDMQDESEFDDLDDDASDASAHSLVNAESMFANSASPKRFNFKRRPKKA